MPGVYINLVHLALRPTLSHITIQHYSAIKQITTLYMLQNGRVWFVFLFIKIYLPRAMGCMNVQ